jgi:hypothetical protein
MTTTIHTKDGWEFDTSNGCLFHPCGFLTSWFRRDDKLKWVMHEPAAVCYPVSVFEWLDELLGTSIQ